MECLAYLEMFLSTEGGIGNYDQRQRDFISQFPQDPVPSVVPQSNRLSDAQQQHIRRIGRQLSNIAEDFRASTVQASTEGSNMIQFRKRIMFVTGGSSRVLIPVIRTGTAVGTVSVCWRTTDTRAQSGTHYYGGRGNITFTPGDQEQNIEIDVVKNAGDSHVSFLVHLFEPQGATIGPMNPITIHILDSNKFTDARKHSLKNYTRYDTDILVCVLSTYMTSKLTESQFKLPWKFLQKCFAIINAELAAAVKCLQRPVPFRRTRFLTNVFWNGLSSLSKLENIADFLT